MAKRTHSDGKMLESFVRMIQEAYKDLPNTEVLSNVKLLDKEGGQGQIDVLVKINASGFKLTIAIECKDYKKRVGKEKIDAFHSKCSMIEEVDRAVFVSKSGYQSGAIKSAKHWGIELYDIEEVTDNVLRSWHEDLGDFSNITVEHFKDIRYKVQFENGQWSNGNLPDDALAISKSGILPFNTYIDQCLKTIYQVYSVSAVNQVILRRCWGITFGDKHQFVAT